MDHPFVTAILPILNEANFIEKSLGAVLAQDYPPDRLEILVVDGGSTDNTQSIVKKLFADRPHARLLDNPRRIQSAALNIGITAAQGDIVVRIDGHTVIDPDYISRCVEHLGQDGVDNVGGLMRPQGTTYVGRAVARAFNSVFGNGGSKFHYSERSQYVDTVYMGAYHKKVFDQIGGYDEDLPVNEDYELNYRLRQNGGGILLSPDLRSTYYARASLRALGRQFFRYGYWKVQMLRRHPTSMQWRQSVPPLFVVVVIASLLAGVFWPPALGITAAALGVYLVANLGISLVNAPGHWALLPVLPLVFATLHFSWGLGFWWGVLTAPFRALPKGAS